LKAIEKNKVVLNVPYSE